jgi:hypothetical protein
MPDEIIQEVWRAKDRLAKRFKYDAQALAAELRKRRKLAERKSAIPEPVSAVRSRARKASAKCRRATGKPGIGG